MEWLTLMNPTASADTAGITFTFPEGTAQTKDVALSPKSHTTVGINNALSIANISDGIAVHPNDYPEYWTWYYCPVG